MRSGEDVRGAGDELEQSELIADRVPFDGEPVVLEEPGEPRPLLPVGLARGLPIDPVGPLDRAEAGVDGPVGEEVGVAFGLGGGAGGLVPCVDFPCGSRVLSA